MRSPITGTNALGLHFDARKHAMRAGIDIDPVSFSPPMTLWVPRVRRGFITAEVPALERNMAIAHILAHADAEGTEWMRVARRDELERPAAEDRVVALTAELLIPLSHLKTALSIHSHLTEISELLGTSPEMTAFRMGLLSSSERQGLPTAVLDHVLRRREHYGHPMKKCGCVWEDGSSAAEQPIFPGVAQVLPASG